MFAGWSLCVLAVPTSMDSMSLTDSARVLLSKVEVLRDLETKVRQMMEAHEQKRDLWFPSDLITPP
jgi:hypothetical protein